MITYESGYKRSDTAPGYSMIEAGFLRLMANVMNSGLRFGRNNWQLAKLDECNFTFDHLMEHLMRWKEGDRSEPHLAKAAIGCMFLWWHIDRREKEEGCLQQELVEE